MQPILDSVTTPPTAGPPAVWLCDEPAAGPYTAARMRSLAVDGVIIAGRPVKKVGMERWVRAERVFGLLDDEFSFLATPADGALADAANPYRAVGSGRTTSDQVVFVGFWLRLLACGIDIFLLGALFAIGVGVELFNHGGALLYRRYVEFLLFFLVLPALFYWPAFEGLLGATPGKWLFGIRVVDADGRPISIGRACWRNLVRWFGVAFVVLALLDHLMIVFDSRKQALHDVLARTWCIDPRRGGSGPTETS